MDFDNLSTSGSEADDSSSDLRDSSSDEVVRRRKKFTTQTLRRQLIDAKWKLSSKDPRKKLITSNGSESDPSPPLTEEEKAVARVCHCYSESASFISGLGQKIRREAKLEKHKANQKSLIDSEDFDIGLLRDDNGKEYLWILSPLLRKVFFKVLKPKRSVLVREDIFCLPHPFSLLVGRRNDLKEELQSEGTEEAKRVWKVLDHTMATYAPGYVWSSFQKFSRGDSITYDQLWTLFVPGEKVIVSDLFNNPQILILEDLEYRIEDMKKLDKTLKVSVRSVVWKPRKGHNGFVRVHYTMNVPSFVGSRPITSLPIYPNRFSQSVEEEELLETKLVERGRRWQGVVSDDMSCWACKGAVILARDDDDYEDRDPAQISLDSRVLLTKSHNSVELLAYRGLENAKSKTYGRFTKDSGAKFLTEDEVMKEFTLDVAILCPSIVKCVVVSTQKVYLVNIDNLTEVAWNEDIFLNQLVLKQNKKDMLKGLVKNYMEKDFQTMGDFISHKGRGLIIVLHGPPGTGKTFAAESVAEFVRRPLLALSIGDLIADSKNLEERLDTIFTWCKEWNAILLLDEADVVLEARSIEDVRRNGIVSVFLRKLDYFEGIMFLTTNRIGTIDPAFMSRIQISILMDKLTVQQRRSVWENFLKDERLGLTEERHSILEKEIDRMAQLDLNGRQIRNTFNIAQSFAHSRNGTKFMTVQDLTEAAEEALGFQEFFSHENEKARNAARSVWGTRS